MSKISQAKPAPGADREAEETDGRRARSERSREKIVEAVLTLVQRGEITPGAQRVADEAEVSLRTVYRHFEDMESLYKEIAAACEARFMPVVTRPYETTDWKERFREQLDRRARVFEETMYLQLSTISRRFQSDFLNQEYKRNVKLERLTVEALIPDHIDASDGLFAALDIILCFDTYRRLRLENGYTAGRAKDILASMLERTLEAFPD